MLQGCWSNSSIPSNKTIWIKGHGLETNDKLTYSPNNRGAGLDVQNSGGGISTLTDGQTLAMLISIVII